jgi:hypothetical protein
MEHFRAGDPFPPSESHHVMPDSFPPWLSGIALFTDRAESDS